MSALFQFDWVNPWLFPTGCEYPVFLDVVRSPSVFAMILAFGPLHKLPDNVALDAPKIVLSVQTDDRRDQSYAVRLNRWRVQQLS